MCKSWYCRVLFLFSELLYLYSCTCAGLLSYVARTEREFIRQRQAEGIAAALERGVRFGPARIPMPEGFEELAENWLNGYVTATEAGRQLGISRKTFTRRAIEWRTK